MSLIDANRVHEMFMDCLFHEDEDTSNHVRAEGVVHNVGFHPTRLEGYRAEVTVILGCLPKEFMRSGGGGWSFLNAPMDRNGDQWGEQMTAEQLLQLGVGLGLVECQAPRELWPILPGGVPYFMVLD